MTELRDAADHAVLTWDAKEHVGELIRRRVEARDRAAQQATARPGLREYFV